MENEKKTKLATRQRKLSSVRPQEHITVAFQQIKNSDKKSNKENKFIYALSQLKKANNEQELRSLKTLIDKKFNSLGNEDKKIASEFETLSSSIFNSTLKKVSNKDKQK
tara:strand:+ start:191 stop:517 length:327 start_codon:yes stop_codon:yes gene_type:complete